MSDETLRELERRFGETQDPADEARWLAERLRAGLVDPARVAAAAALDYPAALAVLPDALTSEQLYFGLHRQPKLLRVRLAVSAARAVLERGPAPPAARAALQAAEAWARCPCRAHLAAARTAVTTLPLAGTATQRAALAAVVAVTTQPTTGTRTALAVALEVGEGAFESTAAEFAAWALGYPDPLEQDRAGCGLDDCAFLTAHREHLELALPVVAPRAVPTRLSERLAHTPAALREVLAGRAWLVLERSPLGPEPGTLLDAAAAQALRQGGARRAGTGPAALLTLLHPNERRDCELRRLPDLRGAPEAELARATTAVLEQDRRLRALLARPLPSPGELEQEQIALQLAAGALLERLERRAQRERRAALELGEPAPPR